MKYEEFYWNNFEDLNKDTTLAHSFGKDVWEHQQHEINELKGKIDSALNKLCALQYASGERIYKEVGSILSGESK